MRRLLIHGARSVIQQAERRNEAESWLKKLLGRRHKNVATVAVAAKNARIAWAVLAHGRDYETGYQLRWRNEPGLSTGGRPPA